MVHSELLAPLVVALYFQYYWQHSKTVGLYHGYNNKETVIINITRKADQFDCNVRAYTVVLV